MTNSTTDVSDDSSTPTTDFVCPICSGNLVWQSDYELSDLTEIESDEGFVSHFVCSDCGARVEAIYDSKNDERLS
jgi:predicted RNA-binding Zn-ribbon protein involved in translation (DUF1610 family)